MSTSSEFVRIISRRYIITLCRRGALVSPSIKVSITDDVAAARVLLMLCA